MKIKNKLLFAFFLILDILVVGCATYINTISHKINVLLTVIAVFIPLPCLWQTNIDDYTAKTKIGKKIVEQITGIGLLLCIHILFLLILHFIGSILISKEEAATVISITFFIFFLTAISVLYALCIDKKAKKYANSRNNNMIDKELIDKLSIEMKEILEKELEAGNKIIETYQGGFSNVSSEHIFIFLKYPFKTPIQIDLKEIIYTEINDRHYWKAEYTDEKNHQTIACNF